MQKIEYNEIQRVLYGSKKKEPFFVEVPQMNYLCFEGSGHPSEGDYQTACEALYTIAYTIKYEIARKKQAIDFKVNPMEVTWYLDKSTGNTAYTWTMMLMQPDFVTVETVQETVSIIESREKSIASERVIFKSIAFGRCIQCFHAGDYQKMNDTLDKMIAFAKQHHLNYDQYTHDIYLNDMRKTKPENYKTIMRIRTYEQE